MAVARTSSPNTCPHSLKVLFEVRMIEPFVALGDDLEDQVRLGAFERLVANLIDHQDLGTKVGLQFPAQAADLVGGPQVADHVVQGGEVDRETGAAGGDGQGDRSMRFPNSRRTQESGVGLGLNERQGGQVSDLAWVEVGLEGEVVVLEGLVVRQLRQPQCSAEAAVLADGEFLFEDLVKEVEVAQAGLLGSVDELVEPGG